MSRIITRSMSKRGGIGSARDIPAPNLAHFQSLWRWLMTQVELSCGIFLEYCRRNRRWKTSFPFHQCHLIASIQSDIRKATISAGRLLKRSVKKNITHALNPKRLKRMVNKRKSKGSAPNWRINSSNFIPKRTANIFEPGSVNFSSGWFGLGHSVSCRSMPFIDCLKFPTSLLFIPSCLPLISAVKLPWGLPNASVKSRKSKSSWIWRCH